MKIDVLIVGGGIVGLATAYQLLKAKPGLSVRILEKEARLAAHQTGHNSGVVHSGIYYKPGSIKARTCLEGRAELLSFCDEHNVPYENVHKLILATRADELPLLAQIEARGIANGIPHLRNIGEEEIREIEPHANGIRALYIPGCQIVNFRAVAEKLGEEIVRLGGEICLNEKVLSLSSDSVITSARTHSYRKLITCAGLNSDRLAKEALGEERVPNRILPFRGEYYDLKPHARSLVRGLLYPVPDPNFPFLGVHLTRMVGGGVEAGPNAVLAYAREGYRKTDFNWRDLADCLSYRGFWSLARIHWRAGAYEMLRSWSKQLFLRDLQRLVPSLQADDLEPGGSGVRAQVVLPDGKLLDDFSIVQSGSHIHVLNAPSPAATASFSIGRHILALGSPKQVRLEACEA